MGNSCGVCFRGWGWLLLFFQAVGVIQLGGFALADEPHRGTRLSPTQWQRMLPDDAISPDGKWLAYAWELAGEPREEGGLLVIEKVAGGIRHEIPTNRGAASFSADSKTVLAGTSGKGGLRFCAYDLLTWRMHASFQDPKAFKISPSPSRFELALFMGCSEVRFPQREPIQPQPNELIAYSCRGHRTWRIPNVETFSLNHSGTAFAYVAQTEGGGWELVLMTQDSEEGVQLDSGMGTVSAITWSGKDDCIAFINTEGESQSLVSWCALDGANPIRRELLPSNTVNWPQGHVFSDSEGVHVSDNGRFIGVVLEPSVGTRARKPQSQDAPQLWRTKDRFLPTEQRDGVVIQYYLKDEHGWDRMTHVWDATSNAIAGLRVGYGGAHMTACGSFALMRDETPYAALRSRQQFYYDLIGKDVSSGKETRFGTRLSSTRPVSVSPSGERVVEFVEGQWKLHDVRTGSSHPLLRDVVSQTVAMEHRPVPLAKLAAWSADEKTLYLHDGIDVWSVDVNGLGEQRLTNGRASGRRYCIADSGKPELCLAFVENQTKFTGLSVLRGGRPIDVFHCEGLITLPVTRSGGRLAVRFENRESPSNIAVIDEPTSTVVHETKLRSGKNNAVPTERRLLSYRATWGEPLHATLVYPRRYSRQRGQPLVVIVYQRQSEEHFRFRRPNTQSLQDAEWLSSLGYFVLLPDLVKREGDPGRSAVQCLEAALDEAAKIDGVDMNRVGIMGASHGGYNTLMALCTSDRLAAGVAVNPVTDLVSFSVDLYDDFGESNLGFVLSGGDHMELPFWQAPERYLANSPLYLVDGLEAPLLLGVGRLDTNVNWRQSLHFFNAARSLDKDVEMVLYPTAGHGFDFPQFRKRVERFFDETLNSTKGN